MGDCFYVLAVPMQGLINTHSMGNFCGYHTELKNPLQSRLDCLMSQYFYLELQRTLTKLLGAGGVPYGTGTGPPP